MRKRLSSISPVQLGLVFAAFYVAIALLTIPFMLLFMVAAPQIQGHSGTGPLPMLMGFGVGMLIAVPIIYAIFGFIIGIISAVIYNLIAMWTGGVEFTVTDVPA
jgi:hypothetical protein